MTQRREIKKLNKITAGSIAAGDVVENPSSVLRELLDNSIDSGADQIKVYLDDGGIKSLSVEDNGCGIEKSQIPMAFESHATSKIENVDDIYSLKTMGFRGEALYSIGTVSVLSISSDGVCYVNDNGKISEPENSSVTSGTLVKVEGLFDNLPARKQFLKRPSSELALCKKVFTEKAAGFEGIDFMLYSEGEMILYFPKGDKVSRTIQIMGLDKDFIKDSYYKMYTESESVRLYAVSSASSYHKRDRTQIKIFMNNRIIDCFALVQIITNAFSSALPGGAFPFFYLYIENDPSLVDFNIHPAKRECKIRNQNQIAGLLSQMIRDYLLAEGRKNMAEIRSKMSAVNSDGIKSVPEFRFEKSHSQNASYVREKAPTAPVLKPNVFKPSDRWLEKAKEVLTPVGKPAGKPVEFSDKKRSEYHYLGQLFDTFLVVQVSDEVLFIDQHAAHERILYDEMTSNIEVQKLLIPHRFETDMSTDNFLLTAGAIYQEFGILIARVEPMVWELLSVPSACRNEEDEIIKYVKTASGDLDVIKKGIFAVLSCHSAIKSGDKIDNLTAENLLDKVFGLDAMVCPHGRNFTYRISKSQLFAYVGRTL